VASADDVPAVFPSVFDDHFSMGAEDGNEAFFGTDVLRGLIDGIDDFINCRQARWQRFRSLGPALLGSAMWINDDLLVGKIGELTAACVVVSKQSKNQEKLEPLKAFNERTKGIPVAAFSELTGLAPKVDGQPSVVVPYSSMDEWTVPTFRTLGFRKTGNAPIIHAKLALLGNLWWHDEDGTGHVADVIGFEPRRLWISSANFTESSRRSLEVGFWTEDPVLIEGSKQFLVKLMRYSEDIDPDNDAFCPEFADVAFDDDAMAELSGWIGDGGDDSWEVSEGD
jgi:hypothetical protein